MKTKRLSTLRDTSRGTIHHLEIHPAQRTGKGKRAFVTKTVRNRPPGQEDQNAGMFTPQPEPEETVNDDQQGMLNHVAKSFGIAPPAEDDGDGDED